MFNPAGQVNTSIREDRAGFSTDLDKYIEARAEYINAGFQLAYFIHTDRDAAVNIVTDSLEALEVASKSQDKRLYYRLVGFGNSTAPALRTKVSVGEMLLLQHLTLAASDVYEREQEKSHSRQALTVQDMIIRFVKHLIRITTRRNSFHVTLGVSRMLYAYDYLEATTLYSVVVQDPARVKEDCYWRAWKRDLMDEMEERFGKFIERIRRPRKEDRFQTDERSRGWTGLVKNCLRQFTPWDSGCVIPDGFDPERDELPGLAFRGHDPDEQHPVEVNRMHSIIDPNCYGRLTRALRLDDPEQRLAIPKFMIQEDDGQDSRSDGKWRHAAGLTDGELAGISRDLAERAARRKNIKPRFLSVVVNGREVGRLDLTEGNRLTLELSGWVDLIEVRTRDDEGDVKLAVVLLSAADRSSKWVVEHTVVLEGGQKITFGVSFKMDEYGDPAAAVVEMVYEETSLVKGASAFLGQVREQGKRLLDQSGRSARSTALTVLTRSFVFTGHSSSYSPTSTDKAPVNANELIQVLIEAAHSESLLRSAGAGLVAVMEQAHAFRRTDILEATSKALLRIPGSQDLESIGRYYYGLYVLRRGKGDLEQAARLLESVAERAPSPYPVRALISLGTNSIGREDYRTALSFNREALNLIGRSRVTDYSAFLRAQNDISLIKSLDGDYAQAVTILEGILPIAKALRTTHPYLYFDYLNNLAAELNEVGRFEEATYACDLSLASPFACAYPEWHETRQEIEVRKRTRALRPRRSGPTTAAF